MPAISIDAISGDAHRGHAVWVRVVHWIIAASVLVLIFSGIAILIAHPRLYWGQAGNSLTTPIIEIPLGPNYHNIGFGPATYFFGTDGPMSRPRLKEVFNLNGWARSLHFIMAWTLSFGVLAYVLMSLVSGHLVRWLLPSRAELSPSAIKADIIAHMSIRPPQTGGGPPYNLLQKVAYLGVGFVVLPGMVITGLAMAPAVTAAYPVLMDITGGYQSARTLHFTMMCLIVLFFTIHLVMAALTGFKRQIRAMVLGK